jgi:hypothetical protein
VIDLRFAAACRLTESDLVVEVPLSHLAAVVRVLEQCEHIGVLPVVSIGKPRRPRSTGPYSQNHHLNGHCQAIAMETGQDYETVKREVKRMAVSMGYPPPEEWRGETVYKSEADCTVEECGLLIDAAHLLAAELGILLREDEE